MDFFQQLQEQLKNVWTGFSKTQQIVVGGVSLFVFGLLIFSAFFLGKTNYEPLYPDLNVSDSALITAKLKDMKVDYKLDKNGTTILVPSKLKYQLRLDLANQLPQGGVIGFESFNQTKFGETDTDKRVRYLAALQGELTRTIQQMAEVESAKVHIVLPESSVFIRESKPATASVLLKLKPYSNMDVSKVRSIVFFLAHSVEGLLPENVTVIDVFGNLLSEGVAQEPQGQLMITSLTVNQMTIKKQFEDELSRSLQTMLERVLGPGKAVVRANAEFDFDQVETSKEEFGDNVIRSEQLRESTSEGSTSPNSGIPGTESNLTDMPSYQNNDAMETSSETSETIRNYEINRFLETRKKAPGEITKLSVAAIIDGQLSTEEEGNITNIIAGAAGIDTNQVTVSSLAFNTEGYSQLQEQLEQATRRAETFKLVKYGIIALVIISVLVMLFLFFRRETSKNTQYNLAQIPVSNEELFTQLSPDDAEKEEIKKKIDKIAKTQPDNMAKVIRTWMTEDSR